MGKALNRQFTKEDIQMANMHMHMKRCSISFVMGGEQVKNQWDTIIYTLEWMVSEDVEKSKFYTLVIEMQIFWKTFWQFLLKLNIWLPCDPTIPKEKKWRLKFM